jgi:hypothetical protein
LFNHLYGKRKSKKCKTNKCTNNKRRSSGGFLSFGFARRWAINKLATIEDESGRIDPNKADTSPRKSTKDLVMV